VVLTLFEAVIGRIFQLNSLKKPYFPAFTAQFHTKFSLNVRRIGQKIDFSRIKYGQTL